MLNGPGKCLYESDPDLSHVLCPSFITHFLSNTCPLLLLLSNSIRAAVPLFSIDAKKHQRPSRLFVLRYFKILELLN
ncbi:hypothetical protein FRX31_007131 [Thalictrum thalictroides]|uniref:Uncharacterized protein n=1 Tax=Thalictrum thalictroides TaxID=46969 RepID=A0A7J6X0N4_THATH|nr:hypothetical protein FRX31_007131 [Thalictrum thalictroides]